MIAFLAGTIRSKGPLRVVLEASGIGFELALPLSTARTLGEAGTRVELFVQSVFTRDGMALYGFATRDEKDTFIRLTAVKGIGPRAAMNLLSRFDPSEITALITQGKVETLKTVPGIGPKRADMILGKLRETAPAEPGPTPMLEEAVKALTTLGLTRREALTRMDKILNRHQLTLTELLAQALKSCE